MTGPLSMLTTKESVALDVLWDVCGIMELSALAVLSAERTSPLPRARILIASILYRKGFSKTEIGDILGRSEGTVRYYLREVKRIGLYDHEFDRLRRDLEGRLLSA